MDRDEPMKEMSVVGLLGAYERDNFGDILFLERTERYLAHSGVVALPLTPFKSTPELLSRRPAHTLTEASENGHLDGVWTVGGEVAGVAMYAAYGMLGTLQQSAGFSDAPRRVRRRIIRDESGARLTDLAYLPRMSSRGVLRPLPLVVNSVGLSGIRSLQRDMRASAETALREADFVSVRDKSSSALLDELGVPHRLAPDLVHTLRLDHETWASPQARETARHSGHVIVQMSEAVLSGRTDELANALLDAPALAGRELRFLPAGTAPRHDSIELYAAVIQAMKSRNPALDASVSTAVSALEKAREIATSSLVLGTSLHAMIISMSFDVPHVGLEIEKVARYASAWTDPMPTRVRINDLSSAVDRALALEARSRDASTGVKLAHAAANNMQDAISAIVSGISDSGDRVRNREASARRHDRFQRSPMSLATRAVRYMVRPLS
ncbi:MAG: hypothetical protein ABS62_03150 [Microbacterium sp. SCN 70-200]|nr:MAG: hypothetical protein ABS62_03150 [Microbacterium sp. SCN 70-200]OJV85458.1 MAG: hypothetical protein BGO46_09115 [Microbacterium sp. 70-16]